MELRVVIGLGCVGIVLVVQPTVILVVQIQRFEVIRTVEFLLINRDSIEF